MELVEGETLAQIIARLREADGGAETPFGPRDDIRFFGGVAAAFADVAEALQHAHSKGVIHRDVKPSNLILDGDGRLRILDFGLARLEGQEALTVSADVLGTPLYMSPEQARRARVAVDHRTDVYSLGATAYELLTGEPPFRGKSSADTLSQIIEREPASPRRCNPRIPQDLETIVLKCLRKDAGERYSTAEALGQDLRRFVRGDPIEARPPNRLECWLRRLRRSRGRIAGGIALGLVVALACALALLIASRRREAAENRYRSLIGAGIDTLEASLLTAPFASEGEAFSLGILFPPGARAPMRTMGGAIDTFRQAARLRPERPEACVYLSRALRATDSNEEGRSVLDEAIRRSPWFPPATLLKIHDLHREGRGAEAELLRTGLEAAHPAGWQRDWIDAHAAAVRADWSRVEDLYTSLLRVPREPFVGYEKELRFRRGRVLLGQERRISAMRDFDHVREESGGALGPSLVLASALFEIDERDEGWAILEEAIDRSLSDEELHAVGRLLFRYGELDRLAWLADRFRDPCERYMALLASRPSVALGEEAIAAGCDRPMLVARHAEALLKERRGREALDLLRRGLERHPRAPALVGQCQRVLYFLCEYDEILELARAYPDHPASATNIGWASIRKGELDEALEVLTAEIERRPRAFVAHYGRAWIHWARGDLDRSLDEFLRVIAIHPGWGLGQALRRLYALDASVFEPRWEEVDRICAAAIRRRTSAHACYLGFRALALVHLPDGDTELALELADEAVSTAERRGPGELGEALGCLGEVRYRRGEIDEAIRVLERAERMPHTWVRSSELLAECRRLHLPRLASCASASVWLRDDRGVDHVGASEVLAEAPRTVREYLEACLLAREGRHSEAMSRLEDLVAARGDVAPEPVLTLADWRAGRGRAESALGLIEGRFATDRGARIEPWVTWARIASEGGLSIAGMVERLDRLLPDASGPVSGLRWLLAAVRGEGVARINCGGPDHVDASGRTWGRDRFHEGGTAYGNPRQRLEIDGDHALYHDHRRFRPGDAARPAYRIPAPSGVYEVSLGLCAPDPRPERRRFRIEVEGVQLGEGFDLERDPGIGALREETLEVRVTDGALDIRFEPLPGGYALVNTLEVRHRSERGETEVR